MGCSTVNNFLSDDERHPVTLIGANVARAVGSNATSRSSNS
jgi:hypothetical protein